MSSSLSASELAQLKKEIRACAECVRAETVGSIEQQVAQSGVSPRLPLFFVLAWFQLRHELCSIGQSDRVVDFLPGAVNMAMLTECGQQFAQPSEPVGPLDAIVDGCLRDVTAYVCNVFHVSGRLPQLPHSYVMSFAYLQRKVHLEEHKTPLNVWLVRSVPTILQNYITQLLGSENVPADYVKSGEALQYHGFN